MDEFRARMRCVDMRSVALHLANTRPLHWPARSRAPFGLTWRRELARVAVIYLIYDAIRLLPSVRLRAADRNGRRILDLEQWLHLDPERALNAWLQHLPTAFPVIASFFYESLHYLVTPLVLIWIYRTAKPAYARARNWLATMTLSALLVFWLFPVTPPRMLPGARMFDIVAEEHRFGWWSGAGTAPHGLGSFVDEYAAMPSLHVGWALWCGIQIFTHAKRPVVRAAGAVYPVLTAMVVMTTGNHYLLDAIAGVAVAGLGWLAVTTADRVRVRVVARRGILQPYGSRAGLHPEQLMNAAARRQPGVRAGTRGPGPRRPGGRSADRVLTCSGRGRPH